MWFVLTTFGFFFDVFESPTSLSPDVFVVINRKVDRERRQNMVMQCALASIKCDFFESRDARKYQTHPETAQEFVYEGIITNPSEHDLAIVSVH